MAMYDWNGDGKIDLQDDYRECQMYQTSAHMQKKKRETGGLSTGTNSSGDSGIAVLCTVFGLFFAGFVLQAFPDMPAVLCALLWIFSGLMLRILIDMFGK